MKHKPLSAAGFQLISLLLVAFFLSASTATGSPYWIEWTGDAFPETEGWERYGSDPPPLRWLEDGSLFIDSRAPGDIWEEYGYPADGMMTPNVGECFILQWRLKVLDVVYEDPGVGVWSDDQHALVLAIGRDYIQSAVEGTSASFAPLEWHEFTLRSEDMLQYELYIDDVLGMEGMFYESLFDLPGVTWGDISSSHSLAAWDYAQFGIVPEPSTGMMALIAVGVALCRRRQPQNIPSKRRQSDAK